MMKFLFDLGPVSPQHVPCSRGAGVICEFVERTKIPRVYLELDLCVNVFGVSDESEAL